MLVRFSFVYTMSASAEHGINGMCRLSGGTPEIKYNSRSSGYYTMSASAEHGIIGMCRLSGGTPEIKYNSRSSGYYTMSAIIFNSHLHAAIKATDIHGFDGVYAVAAERADIFPRAGRFQCGWRGGSAVRTRPADLDAAVFVPVD